MDISKIELYHHGFFQDIVQLLKTLGKTQITIEEAEAYALEKLKNSEEPKAETKKRARRGRRAGPTRGGGRRRR